MKMIIEQTNSVNKIFKENGASYVIDHRVAQFAVFEAEKFDRAYANNDAFCQISKLYA